MATKHVIEVPLPDGVEPTPEDLELLERAFKVLLCMRFGEALKERESLARLDELVPVT